MSDLLEIIITSDTDETSWSICAWDPRTGTQLQTYKGGGTPAQHSLSSIRNEFLISANSTKPLLHIWPLNSQEQQGTRLVTPRKCDALVVSPDGFFCIAGCSEDLYVWEIATGRLLSVLSKHYQKITKLVFSEDGSMFISAGSDGNVSAWKLLDAVSQSLTDIQRIPIYTISDHSLAITDVSIGRGNVGAYMATVSLDRSCCIYSLITGILLLKLVFIDSLTAVKIDHNEHIYCGSTDGKILTFNFKSPPRTKEYHMSDHDITSNIFVGHKDVVTAISISIDGETMISSSNDKNLIIWHIASKQIIRAISHKSSVKNAFFLLAPRVMFDAEQKLNLIVNNFKRMIDTSVKNKDEHVVEVMMDRNEYENADTIELNEPMVMKHFNGANNSNNVTNGNPIETNSALTSLDELKKLQNEIIKLQGINKQLFRYYVSGLMDSR